MIRKFFAALLAAALSVASAPAIAQSSATPVLPGLLVTSGCPSGVTTCYLPYSSSNPMPVNVISGGGGGSNAAAVAQASTTAGQFGSFTQAATLASAPTYTAGTTNPIWTNTGGALATFFPVTPSVNAIQSGTWNITNVSGTVSLPTNAAMETGGNLASIVSNTANNATAANQTSVQASAGSDASKALSIQGITGGKAIPISAAALPLPSGAATEATLSTFSSTTHADLIAATPAGTNLIGKVGIDQTTPGTTNAVSATNFPATVATNTGATGASSPRVTVAVDSATVAGSTSLPAGTNLIGKTGIDQTTPGTTNGVVATGNVASGATDSGNPIKTGNVFNTTQPTVTTGQRVDDQATNRGEKLVAISQGATLASVSNISNDTAAGPNALAVRAFGQIFGTGSVFERTRSMTGVDGTGLGVTGVALAPCSNANCGLVPVVSTTLESCHVLKASAGNLYTLAVTIQATTGIVQIFNATSAPGDGAVTPIWSMPVISNGTLGGDSWNFSNIPFRGSTGLTVCFSSATTPFTKTASATAMFTAEVQ